MSQQFLEEKMWSTLLLYVAISRSSPTKNNSLDVYRGLASVCHRWRDVIESDHFRQKYFRYIAIRELPRATKGYKA